MKNLPLASLLAVVVISFVSATPLRAEQNAEKAAQEAAESWLASVDSGKYSSTWQEAAQIFKQRITLQQWQSAIQTVRIQLGSVEKRKLKRVSYAKTLPGAPSGEYVIIHYETAFENKKSAIETITPMKEKDGQWRVSGYFIN